MAPKTFRALQVFDLSTTTVETAVQSVFSKLEELDGQGFSAARYIASKVSFVLVGDHKRVYNTLQVPFTPPLRSFRVSQRHVLYP